MANKIYYSVEKLEMGNFGITVVSLSRNPKYLPDSGYEKLGRKFSTDFPQYYLEEEMEAVFSVTDVKTGEQPSVQELKDAIKANPEYEEGKWVEEEQR